MKEKKIKRNAKREKSAPGNKKTPKSSLMLKTDTDLFYWGALLIVSLITFWSLTVDSRTYTQGDNVNDAIFYHQVNQYDQQTGEIARWNPYIFGGVPNIFNLPKSAWTIDFYIDSLARALSLPFVFFWLGAMGMYLLLRHLAFSRLQAFFGSLVFLLAPFYKSLVINGHGTKIQAIMYAPWIFWALFRLLKDKKWLDVLLLALVAGMQVRTSHYQVVFYTAVLCSIFVISKLVKDWRAPVGVPWKQLLLLAVAAVGTLLISARPLLLAVEYAGESVRGREVIRLSDDSATAGSKEKGVSKAFVRNWSFSPSELMTLLVARAKGGTSSEYYAKARSIGFRQDIIPGYWGHSPYNGSYYYMGAFIFFLLLVAFAAIKANPFLWPLGAGLALMLIWSLGTFAGPFYDLSYTAIPFFANFRTPTTSMAMVYLLAAMIATYGLRSMSLFGKHDFKKFRTIIGIGLGIVLLLFLFGNSLSYLNEKQNYQQNVLDMILEARRSMFFTDLLFYAISFVVFAGVLWLKIGEKIDVRTTVIALLVLSVVDLAVVWNRYSDETISRAEFNRTYLGDSQTSTFLKSDPSTFRVFVQGNQNFGLPAHVQTIGGGYDMQMNKSLYELTNNNLFEKLDGRTQINWNVLDFMNVKYIVSERAIEHEKLNQEMVDAASGLYVYRYKFNKERGFFVDDYQVVRDPVARMKMINSPAFDARRTAILEDYPTGNKPLAASRSKVDLISFNPNKIVYTVETVNPGLFVMSDIYQPKLQKVYIDGDEVNQVFKTNHSVQSVVVPQGLHTIEIRYDPGLFSLSQWVSNISFILIYLLAGFFIYRQIKVENKKSETSIV